MKKRNGLKALVILGLFLTFGAGCSTVSSNPDGDSSTSLDSLKQQFIANYARIVSASYEDSRNGAENLRDAVETFVNNPNQGNFDSAKAAWLQAREPYGQTEVYRFYDGPIDNPDTGPEPLINAWPLDEAVIDYVDGDPNAGIVNDGGVTLDAETLSDLNEKDADDAITTGYHALEFLLWGQDLNADPSDAGLRPYTDYANGGTADNQDRRRTYLNVIAGLLVDHLDVLVQAWAEGDASNYRAEFLALNPNEALRRIIVGMGSLAGGELGGERMAVALLAKDQEDEHSCFSDNTHRDIFLNFRGLLNLYEGSYTRSDGSVLSGVGLSDLLESVDPDLNAQIQEQFDIAQAGIEEIDALAKSGTHFDQQILGNDSDPDRQRIQGVVDALQTLADLLSEAAAELGIDINLDANGA